MRRSSSFNTGRIEHLYQNPQTHTEGSEYAVYTVGGIKGNKTKPRYLDRSHPLQGTGRKT